MSRSSVTRFTTWARSNRASRTTIPITRHWSRKIFARATPTRGILVCGSGVGVSVAANKFKGIRAGLCHDHYSAHQGVEHDDMNVLVLGSRIIGPMTAQDATEAFLKAQFQRRGAPRPPAQ